MPIKEIDIVVKDEGTADEIQVRIGHLLCGFPLGLTSVNHVRGLDWRCRFTVNEGIDVGFRKIAELQSVLAGEFDIRLVECVSGPAAHLV
ncbi:MAG: hypothetical protein EBV24_04685 [Actinobacteria bacterium]|nr:hypothetical protein [Actinomycetota bacterium]